MHFTSAALVAASLSLHQATATGGSYGRGSWGGHSYYSTPDTTDNKCSTNQTKGYDWSDLSTGSFNSYGSNKFSGWSCSNSFGKRDLLTKRTFQSKCITSNLDDEPAVDCDGDDKMSIKTYQVSSDQDEDVDIECHYTMPDKTICKEFHTCASSGSIIKNTQCGGAKKVTFKPHGKSKGKGCNIGVHSIEFDCKTASVPPSYSTTSVSISSYSQPPVYTTTSSSSVSSAETTSIPSYGSSSSETPSQYSSATKSVPSYPSSSTESVPAYSSTKAVPSYPSSSSESIPAYSSASSVETSPATPSSTKSVPSYPSSSSESIPAYSSASSVETSPATPSAPVSSLPGYGNSSTIHVPIYGSSSTQTSNVPVETPSYPQPESPDVLPKCINSWLHLTQCKGNTDYECFCKNSDLVSKVYKCVSAWSDNDDDTNSGAGYFMGICAKYVPENPAIITACPSTITPATGYTPPTSTPNSLVSEQPPAYTHKTVTQYSTIVATITSCGADVKDCSATSTYIQLSTVAVATTIESKPVESPGITSPPAVPYTTITYSSVHVEPVTYSTGKSQGVTVPSSSYTTTFITTVTVPKVQITTYIVTESGSTHDVPGLGYETPAPAPHSSAPAPAPPAPYPTASAPGPVGPVGSTSLGTTYVPKPTNTITPYTGAGNRFASGSAVSVILAAFAGILLF